MNLINRYIASRIIKGIALAFVIVTAIIMLVDFVESTRDLGENSAIPMTTIMGLTLLKTPQVIEQTIPFVVLFGAMGALYNLNRRSELIVLRASGLSAWRFLKPALWVSAILGIIWALVFNPLAAQSMQAHRDIVASWGQDQSRQDQSTTDRARDVWLREGSARGQVVIHGTQSDPSQPVLDGVTFYYYDFKADETSGADDAKTAPPASSLQSQSTQFTRRIDATRATLLGTGYWRVQNMIENQDGAPFFRGQTASIPTTITKADLGAARHSDRAPPFWALPSEIKRSEAAGFSSVGLHMRLHRLLSLPLTLVAMTIIAAGVSMQMTRSGGTLRLMLIGAAVGFGVFFIDNLISAFGQAQSLPVILAAWAVPIFILLASCAFLSRVEDG